MVYFLHRSPLGGEDEDTHTHISHIRTLLYEIKKSKDIEICSATLRTGKLRALLSINNSDDKDKKGAY